VLGKESDELYSKGLTMLRVLSPLSPFFLQQDDTFGIILSTLIVIVGLVVGIVELMAMWNIFIKAGKPGWAVLIPIYNLYIVLEIVGREWWWLLFMMIPIVNGVFLIILVFDLAKSFGKGTGFALGLLFLDLIFILILGFGDARYVGPAVAM